MNELIYCNSHMLDKSQLRFRDLLNKLNNLLTPQFIKGVRILIYFKCLTQGLESLLQVYLVLKPHHRYVHIELRDSVFSTMVF